MIARQNFKENVDIIYFKDSTKVTNSYLLSNDEVEKVASEIEYSRSCKFDWKCIYLRNKKSYINEIKAHNNLYKMGLFKRHTIDTDLEEKITIIKKIIYFILGR